MLSEYRHCEETYWYLLNGDNDSLLMDTGLGICNIHAEVKELTNKPVGTVSAHRLATCFCVFPAHHGLDIQPETLRRIRNAFQEPEAEEELHHGS